MNCQKVLDLMILEADGEATAQEIHQIEIHASRCPSCRKEREVTGREWQRILIDARPISRRARLTKNEDRNPTQRSTEGLPKKVAPPQAPISERAPAAKPAWERPRKVVLDAIRSLEAAKSSKNLSVKNSKAAAAVQPKSKPGVASYAALPVAIAALLLASLSAALWVATDQSPSMQGPQVGVLDVVSNDVFINRNGVDVDAVPGSALYAGDIISSPTSESSFEVRLPNGSRVVASANTQMAAIASNRLDVLSGRLHIAGSEWLMIGVPGAHLTPTSQSFELEITVVPGLGEGGHGAETRIIRGVLRETVRATGESRLIGGAPSNGDSGSDKGSDRVPSSDGTETGASKDRAPGDDDGDDSDGAHERLGGGSTSFIGFVYAEETSRPIIGAQVELRKTTDDSDRYGMGTSGPTNNDSMVWSTFTSETGLATLNLIPAGVYEVVVTVAGDYGKRRFYWATVEPGEVTFFELPMSMRLERLEGRLRTESGDPPESVQVTLDDSIVDWSDSHGWFSFDELDLGVHYLEIVTAHGKSARARVDVRYDGDVLLDSRSDKSRGNNNLGEQFTQCSLSDIQMELRIRVPKNWEIDVVSLEDEDSPITSHSLPN